MKGINLYLYEYVNNYFHKNFPESYILIPSTLIEYKIDNVSEIRNEYVKKFLLEIQTKYDVSLIRDGMVNDEIDKILDSFIDMYFTPLMRKDCSVLYDYVRNLLIKKNVGNKFSSDIFDYFVKSIVARVWSQYDSSRINTDSLDHIIDLIYNNMYSQYEEMISERINQLINYNFDIVSLRDVKIDINELKQFVFRMIIKRENREFLSRLDRLKINPDIELSRTGIELDNYVKQYISLLRKPKQEIKTENVIVSSDNKNDVSQNNEVKRDDCLENIRINSVVGEAVPKKFRVNRGTKQVDKMVVTLSILAIMTINTISISDYIDRKMVERNDRNAIQMVDEIDNFNYDLARELRDKKYYDSMTNHIISVYSKYEQVEDENYKTLSLYNAYKGSSSLNEMDMIVKLLRDKIVEKEVDLNLRSIVHADSGQSYFYLDFVYERLSSMGYNEVNSQEYQDALKRWKYANYGNYYGVVGVHMSTSEKEIIKDVMKKYEECCKKNKLDFGYKIGNKYFDLTSNYDETSVKGHSI